MARFNTWVHEQYLEGLHSLTEVAIHQPREHQKHD